MPPLLHVLLGFLLSALGGFVVATLGNMLYYAGARELLGIHSFVFLVPGGGGAGFFAVLLLWMRFAWIRCPRCRGRMVTAFQGRRQVFDCRACGYEQ
jgi:hypothetical protein